MKLVAAVGIVAILLLTPPAVADPEENEQFYCNPHSQLCVGVNEYNCFGAMRADSVDYFLGVACTPNWYEFCAAYDPSGYFGCVKRDDARCVAGISILILNSNGAEYECILED